MKRFSLFLFSFAIFAAGCPTSLPSPTIPDGWSTYIYRGTPAFQFAYPPGETPLSDRPDAVAQLGLKTLAVKPGAQSLPTRTLAIFVLDPGSDRLEGCYAFPDGNVPNDTSNFTQPTTTENGRPWCQTVFAEAAAGNRYHEFVYSTEVGGTYVVLMFIVHSVVCENYAERAEELCEPYNEARDTADFEQILRTFTLPASS